MPAAAHLRVRCNGTMGSPAPGYEIFSYGFSLGQGDFLTGPQLASLQASIEAYHGRAGTAIEPLCILTEVAVSLVGPTGRQIGDTTRLQTNTPGGGSGVRHPPQVAYRVSLDDQIRGRSHRGGWYVPGCMWGVFADSGKTDAASAQAACDSAVQLVDEVNALQAQNTVVIASVLGNLPVTRVRVGRALDTMRSRRNKVEEAYTQALVAA